MADMDLSAHIAWLDREATEKEAFAKALAPYSDPVGERTVGEIVRALRETDPTRAEWLLGWARSFVTRQSSLAARASYKLEFDHNEAEKRLPVLKRMTRLVLLKMGAGTQAFVSGQHSPHEQPALADLRAEAVAAYLRRRLPVSRTVTVLAHVCSDECNKVDDRLHAMRRVDMRIFTRPEFMGYGAIRHRAESTRSAHRSYLESAARTAGTRSGTSSTPAPSPLEDTSAMFDTATAPARALWESLAPYRDELRYDSVGTLVARIEKGNPAEAQRVLAAVQAMIDKPETPHVLAGMNNQTLKFVEKRVELSEGQEADIEEALSEMNQRDGGTCVSVSGWHEIGDEPTLADERAEHVLNHLKRRANPNVRFKLKPHVCGPHCTPSQSPLLRRVGWIDICWQPQHVMIENIRLAARWPH